MSEHLFLIVVCVPFATILIVFAMKYVSLAYQARARLKADSAYRELAEKAVSVQSAAASTLTALQTELSGVATRLAAVEKIVAHSGLGRNGRRFQWIDRSAPAAAIPSPHSHVAVSISDRRVAG